MQTKHLLLSIGLSFGLFSCGGEPETEVWQVPTEGLITTVTEVENDEYRILSEDPIPQIEDSRIIVENMEGTRDTFTLDEAKLMAADSTSTRSRPFRSAGMGFFGYLMIGRMMSGGVNSGAYVNNGAYNRATNTAGSRMSNSTRSVTRTKSGFGSKTSSGGKSTRSFGG
jgi:hypothetical protein